MGSEHKRPLLLLVPMKGFANWGGGIDFIRLILGGLVNLPSVRVVVSIPVPTRLQRVKILASSFKHAIKCLLKGTFAWGQQVRFKPHEVEASLGDHRQRVEIRLHSDTESCFRRLVEEVAPTAVLPSFELLPPGFPVPWVGYIYDFQHHHLPHLFSDRDKLARNEAFQLILNQAKAIIVNSATVKRDAEAFQPGSAGRIVSLPFTAVPQKSWFDLDPEPIRSKFGLPEAYFIVCNQFWVHKDHPTAFRAFAQFLQRTHAQNFGMVCTGHMDDYRAPAYPTELQRLLSDLGIEKKVYLLGHISKSDQIALLRGARALVQPTLCEGGPSGSVVEALSLGITTLVSDIEVNLEVRDARCHFFQRGNPEDLADRMVESFTCPSNVPDRDELLRRSWSMLNDLGSALLEAVGLAESEFRSRIHVRPER